MKREGFKVIVEVLEKSIWVLEKSWNLFLKMGTNPLSNCSTELHPKSISLVHTCSMAILLLAICKARSSSHNSLQMLNYSNKASLYLYRCEIKKHITQYWLMLPLWLSAYSWCIPSMLNKHNKLTRKPLFLSWWSYFCFCCFSAAVPSFYGKEHQMKLNWWVMSTFFL